MFVQKDLTAVASTLEFDNPIEYNGIVSLQYLDGAAGTVVVEGSNSRAPLAQIPANDWESVKLTRVDDPSVKVDNLTAAGIAWAECMFKHVRARKTVGAAPCAVVLGLTYG